MDNNESMENYRQYLFERELAKNTIKNFTTQVKSYFKEFDVINKENLIDWKQKLLEKYKPKTVCSYITSINSYIDYMDMDRKLKLKQPKIFTNLYLENVISNDEYQRLLSGLKTDGNKKWYLIIKLLCYTGCRVSELIRIKYKNIIQGYADLTTKAGKIRRIYIPKSLIDDIDRTDYKDDEFVATNKLHGKQITTRGITHMLYMLGEKYGIRKEVMHAHSFRHRFAKNFLNNSNNLALTADLLGHSNIATTRIYLKMTEEEQKMEIERNINW